MKLHIIDYRPPKIAQMLVLIALILHWTTPLSQFVLYANHMLGMLLGAGGCMLMMWGWWLFKRFDTAICPTATSSRLIVTGIYSMTRNPMYLGMTGMMLGLALYVGTVPFYLAVAAYFTVINWVFCPYEEAKLTDEFGDDYLRYQHSVRRWL